MTTTFSSKLRSFFWPIYGRENKLFTPMACMLALILFAYTVCRGIKDTGVVNAANGAAIITFLKVYAVVPFALLFFILYSWLGNKFNRRTIFYIVITPFLVYFAAYAFLIYPNQDSLQPTTMVHSIVNWFPEGALRNWFGMFFSMVEYWTHASFYVMSELWGSAILSLLFWQFANDIIPVDNAKRFYAHFYILGNVAVMLAGLLTESVNIAYKTNYTAGLQIMVSLVILAGLGTIALYYYMNNVILMDPEFQLTEESKPKKSKKAKMSMGEGIKFLLSSRYLGLIAILVICYGISINLAEVLWKDLAHQLYPNKADYNAYMGRYFFLTGFFTVIVILIGSSILRRFGWLKTALATPILLGVSASLFYLCVIFRGSLEAYATPFGGIIALSVLIGLIQNLASKPTKYAMFDPTKEMAYIPLDAESKMKGKAAVDVVGARLGKSGGSAIGQVLGALAAPAAASSVVISYAPESFAITVGIVLLWIWAVSALGKRFEALT